MRLSPLLVKVSKKHRTIYSGGTWYADETYIKFKGKWTYLYRAVNANGDTLDFMLSQHRSKKSALKFFRQNLHQNGSPHTINIDKSKANTAALVTLTQPYCFTFKIRLRTILSSKTIVSSKNAADQCWDSKVLNPSKQSSLESKSYTCCIKNKYPFEEAIKIQYLAFTPCLANDWPI